MSTNRHYHSQATVTTVTNPVGLKNVAGTQINPATSDNQTTQIAAGKRYGTNAIDDYTTASTTYICKEGIDTADWWIVKISEVGNFPVFTHATVTNNPTYLTYAAADPAIVFDGDTNDGQITWKEDEDYFQFEDHVFWANPMYNDVNVGGLVLRTGGTAPGVVQILDNDGDNTGIYTVGFAVNEEGSGVMEIPHDYKEGTDLVFHVHWGANDAPSGTDNVRWQVTYSISRDSNTFPDSTAVAADDVAYDTQYEWLRTDVATITGSTGGVDGGNIKIGDQFHFSIKRIAAVGDAFGGEALVASIGFHYQTDTFGSRQIGTK